MIDDCTGNHAVRGLDELLDVLRGTGIVPYDGTIDQRRRYDGDALFLTAYSAILTVPVPSLNTISR